jgi:hypothetical protein
MGLDMSLYSAKRKNDEIAGWRKFNALHQWFVENLEGVDNCEYSPVSKEKLEELVKTLEELQKTKNTELLPTQSGFFFGSTDYDEWYWNYVERTILILKDILVDFDFENDQLLYSANW